VAVSWSWVEPAEGTFDFTLVDGLLDGARQHNLRVVFLWFGSWKNGISSFVPAWGKADQQRFPRVQIRSGKSIEVLSTLSAANREADTRAYVAFMRHLEEVDGRNRTCLMIQLQNEVGVLGDSRDRGAAANAAFAGAVPKELMGYLGTHQATVYPDLAGR
jgi:beta-galactosidase GanA